MAKLDAAIASSIITLGAAFPPAAFAEEAPQSLFPSAQTEQEAKNDHTSSTAKGHPVKVIFGSNFDEYDVANFRAQVSNCEVAETFSDNASTKDWILIESAGGRGAAKTVGDAAGQARILCLGNE